MLEEKIRNTICFRFFLAPFNRNVIGILRIDLRPSCSTIAAVTWSSMTYGADALKHIHIYDLKLQSVIREVKVKYYKDRSLEPWTTTLLRYRMSRGIKYLGHLEGDYRSVGGLCWAYMKLDLRRSTLSRPFAAICHTGPPDGSLWASVWTLPSTPRRPEDELIYYVWCHAVSVLF